MRRLSLVRDAPRRVLVEGVHGREEGENNGVALVLPEPEEHHLLTRQGMTRTSTQLNSYTWCDLRVNHAIIDPIDDLTDPGNMAWLKSFPKKQSPSLARRAGNARQEGAIATLILTLAGPSTLRPHPTHPHHAFLSIINHNACIPWHA